MRMCIEIGGRMLTGENIITGGKTYPTATLLTMKLTWNDLGSNPSFHAERTVTAWPVERPVQAVINLNHGERLSSYRAVNTSWRSCWPYHPTCSDYDVRVHGNWTREALCMWRNIEAIVVVEKQCVLHILSVCVVTQHAKRIRRIMLSCGASLAPPHFFDIIS
jgi:hypothetical protein